MTKEYFVTLRDWLKQWKNHGVIELNCVEPIRDRKKIRIMRNILRKQSIRNELLFILGINVGLRISDILKLQVRDILKPNGEVKEHILIKERKTGKTKIFYLGNIVIHVIQEYKKRIQPVQHDYVFKSRKGKNQPISRQQAYRILNKAAEIAGLVERDDNGKILCGEIGTHTLRKSFGYHAYKKGVDIALLMELFNHSNEKTTLKYIGITEEEKKSVYMNLNLG